MGVTSKVVCHTSCILRSNQFNVTINYREGFIYEAHVYGEDAVDVYDEDDNFYSQLTAVQFFQNFNTIYSAQNEEVFYKILCPQSVDLKEKFNNLLILTKWQEKQKQLNQI